MQSACWIFALIVSFFSATLGASECGLLLGSDEPVVLYRLGINDDDILKEIRVKDGRLEFFQDGEPIVTVHVTGIERDEDFFSAELRNHVTGFSDKRLYYLDSVLHTLQFPSDFHPQILILNTRATLWLDGPSSLEIALLSDREILRSPMLTEAFLSPPSQQELMDFWNVSNWSRKVLGASARHSIEEQLLKKSIDSATDGRARMLETIGLELP